MPPIILGFFIHKTIFMFLINIKNQESNYDTLKNEEIYNQDLCQFEYGTQILRNRIYQI